MTHQQRGFCHRQAAPLLILIMLLCAAVAQAQYLQPIPNYGYQWKRGKFDSLFATPADTLTVPATLQGVQWYAVKDKVPYAWNTSALKWESIGGGISQATLDDSTAALRAAIATTGITSLNGATNQSQTFTFTSAAGTMGWFTDNVTGIHTLRIPVADASGGGSTTGLVSGTTQTFAGRKTFNAGIVLPLINQTADTTDWKPLVRHSTGVLAQGWWYNTGAGGTSTLAGATDAAISSPTTNQVLAYNGEKWANTNTIAYDFTSPTAGQLLRLKTSTTVENFTPTYAQQQALEDSIEAVRSAIGTGGGTSGYDSIAVTGETTKAAFEFNPSDTSLNVTWGGTTFHFKQNGGGGSTPAGIDPDVQAWATASGITDATYTTHVSTFVTALKTAGIYTTHFEALYVLAGGSEAKVKLNLLDPQDNNTAHRLTFPNGATFSTTGVTLNGTNQYIHSNTVPGAMAKGADDDFHVGVYERTEAAGAGTLWGLYQSGQASMYLYPYMSGQVYLATVNHGQMNTAATTGKGFFLHELAGNGANSRKLYRDNTLVFDGDEGPDGNTLPTTYPMVYGASNNNTTINEFRACEISVISVGKAFTPEQRTAYQNAVAQLVTNLGL